MSAEVTLSQGCIADGYAKTRASLGDLLCVRTSLSHVTQDAVSLREQCEYGVSNRYQGATKLRVSRGILFRS